MQHSTRAPGPRLDAHSTPRRPPPLSLLTSLTVVLLGACGAATDTEMFSETQAALAEQLGHSCASRAVEDDEVEVVGGHPSCAPGYCVTRGGESGAADGEGICSCRCDGPEGTGPFCQCGDGFACKHLIHDVLAGRELAGSYCMPVP